MAENVLEKAEGFMHNQPWYVWAGLLTGGGIVTWYVLKSRATKAASSSNASAANADLTNGYDVASLAGIPYGYITGYTSGQGPTDNYPPTQPPTTTPPPAKTEFGIIRAQDTKNPVYGKVYDAKHSGVPVRNAPGGSPMGEAAWGSEVAITGDAVSGGDNGNGVRLWFPVTFNGQPGYISVADIVSIIGNGGVPPHSLVSHSGTGSGSIPSDWEIGLNKYRNTVDQYHFAYMGGGGDATLV